jgi:hypothetical protein
VGVWRLNNAVEGPGSSKDPFDASVTIRFADGTQQDVGMDALNVMEPASHSWRLALGTTPTDPSMPAPASIPS